MEAGSTTGPAERGLDAAGSVRLPELEDVWWRRPIDERALRLREWLSAAYTTVYCTPLIAAGVILIALEPLLCPSP